MPKLPATRPHRLTKTWKQSGQVNVRFILLFDKVVSTPDFVHEPWDAGLSRHQFEFSHTLSYLACKCPEGFAHVNIRMQNWYKSKALAWLRYAHKVHVSEKDDKKSWKFCRHLPHTSQTSFLLFLTNTGEPIPSWTEAQCFSSLKSFCPLLTCSDEGFFIVILILGWNAKPRC